jgi:hypothetical protein
VVAQAGVRSGRHSQIRWVDDTTCLWRGTSRPLVRPTESWAETVRPDDYEEVLKLRGGVLSGQCLRAETGENIVWVPLDPVEYVVVEVDGVRRHVRSVVSPVCPPNLVISWVEQLESEDTLCYLGGGHNSEVRERELATRKGPERRGCFRKAFYVLFGTIIGLGSCDNPGALTQSVIPRMQ